MFAEIITIGDELLIGQTIDTNSAWIGEQLSLMGVQVYQISAIRDDETHILKALDEAKERVNVVIITGGLGPTKDDITKHTLCKYFKTELVLNSAVFEGLKERYDRYNVPFNTSNQAQALVPKSCTVLPNTRGTASGMWFEENGVIFISLPGVPFEMKGILTDEGFPKLKTYFNTPSILHKTVRTIGIPESKLAEILENWEDSLKENELKLAYLPAPGFVRLRITGINDHPEKVALIQQKAAELLALIGDAIYGEEKETLEEVIGRKLLQQNKTVSTAESCTGGSIAKKLTSIAGSSAYFKGSIIAYANEIKINILNVPQQDIETYGAVSQTVVEQMAENARRIMRTDYAIATSGIAGPTGGSEEKPVGTVWIAVASNEKVVSLKYVLPYNNRERNIAVATSYALNFLRTSFLID